MASTVRLPKCFQMYKKISGHIIFFPKIQLFSKFTFSCPENYLNSPENLLQIYLNLPNSALEIYLKFLMSNYQGCGTPPPPPVSFKQTLSDLLFMYFTSQNIVHHTRAPRAFCLGMCRILFCRIPDAVPDSSLPDTGQEKMMTGYRIITGYN